MKPNIRIKTVSGESFPLSPVENPDLGVSPDANLQRIKEKANSSAMTHLIFADRPKIKTSWRTAIISAGWESPVFLGWTEKSAVYGTRKNS